MTNLIQLLISKNLPDKAKKFEKAAISAYDSAFAEVEKKAKGKDFGKEELTVGLEIILAKMLSSVNLLDKKQYMRVSNALSQWEFQDPWDPGVKTNEKAQELSKMYHVKAMLVEFLLPALQMQQRKEALKKECLKYYEHLDTVLEKEYKKNTPNSESIKLIKAKKRAIEGLHNTLRTKNENISQQLANFKGLLKENKEILATRRDSTEVIIFKSIITILSLGAAYAFGLWSKEGDKTGKKMDSILEDIVANESHLKSPRRKQA